MTDVKWMIRAREFVNCNCAYGCPCQFNALPTYGDCQAVAGMQIDQGYHGDTRLDGLRFVGIFRWPGAIHEGKGEAAVVIDERASEAQRSALNLAWHRLDAWPDVPPGMARLKRKYMLAPVSNGNISLMVDLARRNNLPWDAILGSEIAGDYKPKPRVYLAAAQALDLPPHDCMMVAAHTKDLMAAAALGLRTGHIARPNEHGPGRGETAPSEKVDFAAKSLEDLAGQLGT